MIGQLVCVFAAIYGVYSAEPITGNITNTPSAKPVTAESIKDIVNNSTKFIKDELKFEDVVGEEVNYSLFFFKTSGTINLTNGKMKKMSNYSVRGNIKEINSKRFDVPIRFRILDFDYNYESKVPYISNKGNMSVELENIDVTLPIRINANNVYELDHMPKAIINFIHVMFSGQNGLKDFFLNLINDSYEDLVKHLFFDIYLLEIIHFVVDAMNKAREHA